MGPAVHEARARSPGGGAVAVRAGTLLQKPRGGARRCGTTAAREEILGAVTVKMGPQMVLWCSPAVPASCAPFPLPHPFSQTTLRIRTLQSPPLLGLGPCKLQDQRAAARKSKRSIRERITYTHSPSNPKEKDQYSPCSNLQRIKMLSIAAQRVHGGKRRRRGFRGIRCFRKGGGGGEGVGRSGPVFPPRLLIQN